MKFAKILMCGLVTASSSAKLSVNVGAISGISRQTAGYSVANNFKADKNRDTAFFSLISDVMVKTHKIFEVGAMAGLFVRYKNPEQTKSFPGGPTVLGKFKTRHAVFAFGPEFKFVGEKLHVAFGVAATLAGYKFTVQDTNNPTDTGSIKTPILGTLSAMPFVKIGFNLSKFHVFGFTGYNIGQNASLKNRGAADPGAAKPVARGLYNEGVTGTTMKTTTTYFGIGLSTSL